MRTLSVLLVVAGLTAVPVSASASATPRTPTEGAHHAAALTAGTVAIKSVATGRYVTLGDLGGDPRTDGLYAVLQATASSVGTTERFTLAPIAGYDGLWTIQSDADQMYVSTATGYEDASDGMLAAQSPSVGDDGAEVFTISCSAAGNPCVIGSYVNGLYVSPSASPVYGYAHMLRAQTVGSQIGAAEQFDIVKS